MSEFFSRSKSPSRQPTAHTMGPTIYLAALEFRCCGRVQASWLRCFQIFHAVILQRFSLSLLLILKDPCFFFLRIFTIHLCCGNRGDGSPSDHQLLKVLDGLDRQKGVAGGRCGWVPGFPAGGAGPRRPAFDMPSGTAAQWAPELIIRRY